MKNYKPFNDILPKNTLPLNEDVSFSFELFPPKTEKANRIFWESATTFGRFKPSFISVTCGAGGTEDNLDTARLVELKRHINSPAVAHLTCISRSKQQIHSIAEEYWANGIRHIVALRGDPPENQSGCIDKKDRYLHASDLVSALKGIAPFEISVAGYPEGHPEAPSRKTDVEYLKRKVDAGADRIITQFFFGHHHFLNYRDAVRTAGIHIPVVPGILPILNFKNVVKFAEKCGTSVPSILHEVFNEVQDDETTTQMISAYLAMQQCESLYDEGVRHFHFFTLNSSAITNMLCSLIQKIRFKNVFCKFCT